MAFWKRAAPAKSTRPVVSPCRGTCSFIRAINIIFYFKQIFMPSTNEEKIKLKSLIKRGKNLGIKLVKFVS